MKARAITHEFVDSVPAQREEGKLYVSLKYRTAIHSCFCGCGNKVVTPIRPAAWHLIFDGDTVSLDPSIGNSGHSCGAHYWIRKNNAVPAGHLSQAEIARGRKRDVELQDAYYRNATLPGSAATHPTPGSTPPVQTPKRRWWAWLTGKR